MKPCLAFLALPAVLVGLSCAAAQAAERFEVASWVDHHDFAGVRDDKGYVFDCDRPEGWAKILDHVQEVGTTLVLWRNCGGANMRYQSLVESHHHDPILDKRRVPETRVPWGWVRYGDAAEEDMLRWVVQECGKRGLRPGVHWPFEETHWEGWTIGGWNLEHPYFWGRTPDGQPWWGRASLSFPEVMAHKLALVDELLDRGIEALFIDFYRNGGWTPAYEYVEPVVAAYRAKYGAEPSSDSSDPRWCRHVGSYVTEFLRRIRKHAQARGQNLELMVGIPGIAPLSDEPLLTRGADWQAWVDEGLVDAVVINYVKWDPQDPFGSMRKLSREVMDVVKGRCKVFWPVQAYDFSGFGMPSCQKATGLSQPEVAERLLRMAWEEGAHGISLECVDYNNYAAATRERMRALVEGECEWVQPVPPRG